MTRKSEILIIKTIKREVSKIMVIQIPTSIAEEEQQYYKQPALQQQQHQ